MARWRSWLAWRLMQLSRRLNDGRYRERLAVYTSTGTLVVEWKVIGDAHGLGVFSDFQADYPGCEVVREQII